MTGYPSSLCVVVHMTRYPSNPCAVVGEAEVVQQANFSDLVEDAREHGTWWRMQENTVLGGGCKRTRYLVEDAREHGTWWRMQENTVLGGGCKRTRYLVEDAREHGTCDALLRKGTFPMMFTAQGLY